MNNEELPYDFDLHFDIKTIDQLEHFIYKLKMDTDGIEQLLNAYPEVRSKIHVPEI